MAIPNLGCTLKLRVRTMKRFGLIWLLLLASGCAIGSRIEEAVEEIEGTLGELHADQCMEACNDEAVVCWDEINGPCGDGCQNAKKACEKSEDACLDLEQSDCWSLNGAAYHQCMDAARDTCDKKCDDKAAECYEACGDEAMECLTGKGAEYGERLGLSMCIAGCVKELQDSLKGIDL